MGLICKWKLFVYDVFVYMLKVVMNFLIDNILFSFGFCLNLLYVFFVLK